MLSWRDILRESASKAMENKIFVAAQKLDYPDAKYVMGNEGHELPIFWQEYGLDVACLPLHDLLMTSEGVTYVARGYARHWAVTCYLDRHPEARERYWPTQLCEDIPLNALMYFDILDLAEEEYYGEEYDREHYCREDEQND